MARPWERKFLGFSFTNRESTEAAHRAEGPGPVQGAGPGTDASDTGDQPGADGGRRSRRYLTGLARLLRLLRDPIGAARTWTRGFTGGCVPSSGSSGGEAGRRSRNFGSGTCRRPGGPNRRQPPRPVAAQHAARPCSYALPNAYFIRSAFRSLHCHRPLNQPNRRVRTRTHGGVTGTAREGLPMSMCAEHVRVRG